nr:unnamed protein product [Digitaria exilis]
MTLLPLDQTKSPPSSPRRRGPLSTRAASLDFSHGSAAALPRSSFRRASSHGPLVLPAGKPERRLLPHRCSSPPACDPSPTLPASAVPVTHRLNRCWCPRQCCPSPPLPRRKVSLPHGDEGRRVLGTREPERKG